MLVLKFGGGDGIDFSALAKNAAALQNSGDPSTGSGQEKIVIVVGANAQLSRVQKERGIEPKMITSEKGEKSRWTDESTLALLKEIYGGTAEKVAAKIVEFGGVAVAQIGSKDNLIFAKRHGRMRILENGKVKVVDGDLTGSIEKIDAAAIQKILDDGKILVVAPPAAAENSLEINVDGDKIASKIASEMQADKLIFFANTPGLLKNVDEEASLIREIPIAHADEFAVGRMKKKILSAKRAIEAGVGAVIFADGRIENSPIDFALSGGGTKVF
ncbi:MAG: [LysW]-aminoadipate kinase [Patescibacteria group bacterium]